mmetsp:Transcript_22328/g.33254  ORF Transcript_22328/g.33254 Transcript_22328/m.33254 type:complete len:347 (-) Transcript_22328:90-1130(-)|eukprot:CAMPEP_0201546348 /NCGR_PEP_ID=MMETSP0173_2-20130828/2650_1 /ASSEMBLY_ACC=CAM_ASM_000268 /TAXON_ID=218659 /ORGANISM="Vexillifera sp., Strain DIVA3 564/2" /LENGTH=346 /DNA_ID=CAMNT_0047954981 /DNA_START=840 /DNA_END=1880 /DNA_ORIENTATION=-
MSAVSWLFGPKCTVKISLDGSEKRRTVEIKREKSTHKLPLYLSDETISGSVQLAPGKSIEHEGIKLELIGQIELFYDRGKHHEFTSLTKVLARSGTLSSVKDFKFAFENQKMPFESYNGINVRLRYFLRVTIQVKRSLQNISQEVDFWVHKHEEDPEINSSIKMEVGIEDCLHIEFEYNKSKYHLKDVIIGKIYFLLVKIKIRHMELSLIKRETTGSGPNQFNENEAIIKYEIMDGAPVRGESIPIRLFLGGFDLTPTYRHVHKKFSVKYYLNLVLVDDDDRRYFKQQEIILRRRKPGSKRHQPTMKYVKAEPPTQKSQPNSAAPVRASSSSGDDEQQVASDDDGL